MISDAILQETIRRVQEQATWQSPDIVAAGVRQVAERWRIDSDGGEDGFTRFCKTHFCKDADDHQLVMDRFFAHMEALQGRFHQVYRDFNRRLHVETGPLHPIDQLFADFDVHAHLHDDFFATKLAFVVLLNVPLASLAEKEAAGTSWSRRRWAELRLAEQFRNRVGAEVLQGRTAAYTRAEDYVYHYNLYMHNLLDETGERLFDPEVRLISHWGLRDALKARYADPAGLPAQRLIHRVMERIVTQEIPREIINSREFDWNPFSNELYRHGERRERVPESPTYRRYRELQRVFHAERALDPFFGDAPSLIDRRFRHDREIAEADVETILKTVLEAPVLKEIAAVIRGRLGRELEPFDIWYAGFRSAGRLGERELDAAARKRFPTLDAFQENLAAVLTELGFTPDKAAYLQSRIAVDPARGAGHALPGGMRGDLAHLRTRVPDGGMDYQGFNTAMHELGHSVEQVFTVNDVDHYPLRQVPNTAFTEAFAFVFQERDLAVLGLADSDRESHDLRMMNEMWQAMEIAGVALLDLNIWRWMYRHAEADSQLVKQAVVEMARTIWNRYFAPVLGVRDAAILAIYSHLVFCGMYTPDYALGHVIAFQLEDYLRERNLGTEMERMCRLGRLAPQVWMREAVGSPVSAEPLIGAAEAAVARFRGGA